MIENPGFIFELNYNYRNTDRIELINCVNKLPKEYGLQIIKHRNSNRSWLFFHPQVENKLLVSLYLDDDENLILFYGSIYNKDFIDNVNKLKEKLLNIIQNFSNPFLENFLNSLSGYYCGIIGNIKQNNYTAFTDRFGISKLFYHAENGKKIFSTNLFLMKEFLASKAEFSNFAASSIIFCGHTFNEQTIINGVKQVLPGHFIQFGKDSHNLYQNDYVKYTERKNITLEQSIELVASAHRSFWKRIHSYVENDITLLLSRGKDCRVILKHMMDENYDPKIITYFREANKLYPFVSFLLYSKEDSVIAEEICRDNNFNYNKIKIDNISLLKNLTDILLLNNGSPGHWEIFEAAKASCVKTKYLASGFMGDPYAGKAKHRYLLGRITSSNEYGQFSFNKASDIESYKKVSEILNINNVLRLNSSADLSTAWIKQYQSVKSEDMDVVGAEGLLRTRGIGRVVPTFQQARLYTIPIYPYLDTEILNAYLKIPTKYLKGESVHLMQISSDKRFNQYQTTRFSLSAKNEKRYLKLLSLLRKFDHLQAEYKKQRGNVSSDAELYTGALKKTLSDMNVLPDKLINSLLPNKKAYTNDYYGIIANLITMLRIKEVYFNNKVEKRTDLKILDYKSELVSKYE